MLQGGENITTALRTNNQNLLTVDANRNAYVNNVLIPMVTALKGNPGVYSYEIFNEPEGMTTQHGWTQANGGTEVDQSYIQKTVNVFAAAIHTDGSRTRASPAAPRRSDLLERHRGDQPLLEQRAHGRGRQVERHARLLRGPLLHVERVERLLLHPPGLELGAGQEHRDGRVLRAGHRRRERRRHLHQRSTPTATTAPGPGTTRPTTTTAAPDDRLAVDEDADAEPLQRAEGDVDACP